MACNSKTAGRRAKRNEIWDMGTLVTHVSGIVPSTLNCSRSFGTLSQVAGNLGMADRRVNWNEI